MTFDARLKNSLARYAPGKVTFVNGWRTRNTGPWRSGVPKMVFEHHTAGAATESTDPKAKGNQPGANNGVIAYCIQKGNSVPYCNAVIDRDGEIYILAAGPVWHAGKGSFKGTRWARQGIPDDSANGMTFGVEVVSKGRRKDFTAAQLWSIRRLNCAVREASGWNGFKYRIANHKDWTNRKIDTRYPWEFWVEEAKKAWANTR
jgi:hypothetical protein